MKKVIPVLFALIMIVVVLGVAFGGEFKEKYSYSKEQADLEEYYGVKNAALLGEDGNLAIVLQDEFIGDTAVVKDGHIYFDFAFVEKYFNEGFYFDEANRSFLYTTADETRTISVDQKGYSGADGFHETDYVIAFQEGDTCYFAEDFLHDYANFECIRYDRHLQLYTQWGVKEIASVTKATQLRTKGGIKCPILCELEKDEVVEVLDQMESWSKVKTSDSVIGYVENKRLSGLVTDIEEPVTNYAEEEYSSLLMDGRVCLGWHSIGGEGGNSTLDEMVAEGKGMNVIGPTWFSLTDNEGSFRSFASKQYVDKAHACGLKVWGVWDNFNYKNETGAEVSTYEVLSSTEKRQRLVQAMVDTTIAYGIDGINIDYETLSSHTGTHFEQFIKELSVLCRKNGIVLSIDNYMPNAGNTFYRLDTQGKYADYVVLMGYDEHWHGSGDPGSVASIDFVTDGIEKTCAQVPSEKVINALPLYTILWKIAGSEVSDQYITLNNTADFLSRKSTSPQWDETTCQNYLEYEEGGATYKIWIEDEESIKIKLNVMNAHKIGGVAAWRLGYGTPGVWQLISLYTSMN